VALPGVSVPSADSVVGGAGWSWTTCSHQESSGLGSGHTIVSSATGDALSPGWLDAVPVVSFEQSVSDMIVRILSRQLACAWWRGGSWVINCSHSSNRMALDRRR
jgi:hypothetical protein